MNNKSDNCARSSVFSGVTPTPQQKQNVHRPSGTEGQVPIERIRIDPPDMAEREAAGYEFEPVKIGFLIDYEPGEIIADIIDPYLLAFEDAMNEGRLSRPIELISRAAIGLPTRSAKSVIDAYHAMADEGCLLVLCPGVTDNALALCEYVNQRRVPCLAMVGTSRFAGEYCFLLPNGGHGEETALVANYLNRQGYRRIAMFGERSPGDIEYHDWFRDQARLNKIEIAGEFLFDQRADGQDVEAALVTVRDRISPDAIVYCGFGWTTPLYNPALQRIGWNPPKVMNAAFMWAPHDEKWMRALEGWVGVDQSIGSDSADANPNFVALLDHFEARFNRRVEHVLIALAYDQGRVVAEAIANAPILTGHGLKLGLERIKMFPATLGGPRTHITFGQFDHRGYKGDYLVMRQIVDQQFVYRDMLGPAGRAP
jgi:branched-chain amino acid transport system substrate-binding protein